MVATVIVGAMILGAWAIKVTHHQHIAEAPSKSMPSDARPEFVFVGRITGLLDVKWSDDPRFLPPYGFAYVPLGHKYKLDSGLMEITYDTGAKVILQGPCTYEVESSSGGYLALGKLTARVGAVEGKGSSSKVQGSRSTSLTTSHQPLATNSNPQSLIPNPLFSVRTPTALVTDLGTEFGVEVGEEGTTTSHVFRGSVKVLVLDADGNLPSPSGRGAGGEGDGREVILGENESVRVQHGKDAEARLVIVRGPVPGKVDGFVRSLQPDTTRIVEKFDGAKLGAAFEQNPPGRYVNELGAAVYQQPPATDGRQSRGYIRTVATDFCDRDFVFEATFQFHLDAPDRQLLRHRIFFGIGDGVPNSNFYDEVTCGLVLALVLDEGRAFVELCHPDSVAGRDDVKIVAEMAPLTSLRSGKHRFRLWKKGKWVTFAVDADFKGQFLGAFAGRPIDLSVAAPLLDAANSRLLVGTGNCDVMTVRFEELSATYTETKNEQREISPTGTTKSPERGK